MPRLGANQLVLRFGLQSPLGPGSCVPRSLAVWGARANSGLAPRIGTRLISKGWSRFMHETLHHKLNSAIMAWYPEEDFFFLSLVLGLGSGPLGVLPHSAYSNTTVCRPFACATCDASNENNLSTQDIPRLAPVILLDGRTRRNRLSGCPVRFGSRRQTTKKRPTTSRD